MATMAASRVPTSCTAPSNTRQEALILLRGSESRSSASVADAPFRRLKVKSLSFSAGSTCYRFKKDDPSRTLRSDLFDSWSIIDISLERQRRCAGSERRSSLPNVVARLFGPAIFQASKLKVLFLGIDEDKHPEQLPRTYTLTHSDITAKLTLAVSQTINRAQLQGWYSRLQRDEVLAEWKKSQGSMSLHVHCHISGGHWMLDVIAKLRFYIFRKELPVVLEAFRHGDRTLFGKHPELEEALVWVYFHSNLKEFNRVECWGPLADATKGASEAEKQAIHNAMDEIENTLPHWKSKSPPITCPNPCTCCFPPLNIIPLPKDFGDQLEEKIQQIQQA